MEIFYYSIATSLLKILFAVSLGCFIGAVFESRNWMRFASFLAKPLLKLGRLPAVCGTAFLTAMISNPAAASMISSAYSEKKITRKDMFLSAIANSFPAQMSHLIRVMLMIVPILGKTAILYFGVLFSMELLRTIIVLLIARKKDAYKGEYNAEILNKELPSWKVTVIKSFKRTRKILFKIVWITAPIYIIVRYMAKEKMFKSLKLALPEHLSSIIPPEIVAVVLSKFGGLVSCSTVAAEMIQNNEITSIHILFGFFLGNLIDIPIRTVRRNIPVAVGVYPKKDGLWIMLILQSTRMIFTFILVLILAIILWSNING